MGVDKGKKQKLEENNATVHIGRDLLLSIEKLQEAQDELEEINYWFLSNEEAGEKELEIEQKYSEKRKPVYVKRNEIIKSIPDFWMTAFLSHPALSELLTEEDQKIFKYLTTLEVEESKDLKSGCSITFNFKPNPYFEDTKLSKTFTFLEDGTTKISSTSIKWKEGMAIPNGVDETEGNKRSHSEESFFTWFSDTHHKDDIVEIRDEQVAEIIKDDFWPNPLTYFNYEADEEDLDVDDGDDEENGSDSSEENDEDDEVEDGDE